MSGPDDRARDLVVAALLCPPPRGADAWTMRALASATRLGGHATHAAVRGLRNRGKIAFDTLALSPSMLETEELAARPGTEARVSPVPAPSSARVAPLALQAGRAAGGGAGVAKVLTAPDAGEAPASRLVTSGYGTRPIAESPKAVVTIEAVRGMALGDQLQAALIDTPEDATAALRRAWPGLWERIVGVARTRAVSVGAAFFDAIEAGLEIGEGRAAR